MKYTGEGYKLRWKICNIEYIDNILRPPLNHEGVDIFSFFSQIHYVFTELYLHEKTEIVNEDRINSYSNILDLCIKQFYAFIRRTRADIRKVYDLMNIGDDKSVLLKLLFPYANHSQEISKYIEEYSKNYFYELDYEVLKVLETYAISTVEKVSIKCMNLIQKNGLSQSEKYISILEIFDGVLWVPNIYKLNSNIKCFAVAKVNTKNHTDLLYSFNSTADLVDADELSIIPQERIDILNKTSCDNKLKGIYFELENVYPFNQMIWIKTNRNQVYIDDLLGKITLIEYLNRKKNGKYIKRVYSCAERKLVADPQKTKMQYDFSQCIGKIDIYTTKSDFSLKPSCPLCIRVLKDFSIKKSLEVRILDNNGNLCNVKMINETSNDTLDEIIDKFRKQITP